MAAMAERRVSEAKERFFGTLPIDGVWTSVGLTRNQFLGIVLLSTMLFVFVDGPLWNHLRHSHFARIVYSYAMIPGAVAIALRLNGKLRWGLLIAASVVVGLVKLLLTAVVLVAIGLARF
jgi:hypothetical protein